MDRNKGFTLVELVVVVMILGILAAVATPKLLSTSGSATDNAIHSTLSVVRDAVERYTADNVGAFPGEAGTQADLQADLADYLRGDFPVCPVGAKDSDVKITTDAAGDMSGATTPAEGWHYNNKTGEFRVNFDGTASDGTTTYDSF